jgi:zinc protease
VALGFPGADVHHPDRHALDVLAEIASGMSGRFFRSVRGDNALAYQVSGFHRSRLEAGQFIAFTSTAPENEVQAVDLLLAECAKLGQEGVTPEELADAKNSLEGDYAIQLQTFGAQAGELAAIAAYGLSLDEPARYLARIQAVTPEEVQEAARRYLREEFCCRGIVRGGPEG